MAARPPCPARVTAPRAPRTRRGRAALTLAACVAALVPASAGAAGGTRESVPGARASTPGRGGPSPLTRPLWSALLGTARDDAILDVAISGAGLIAVAGTTDGPLDGYPNRQIDAWVASYDAAGSRRWLRRFGTPQDEIVTSVAIADAGDVWVAGDTYGGMQGNVNAGERDGFLTRFAADGTELWNVHVSTDVIERARGLAVRADGSAVVVGTTYGNFPGFSNEGKSREAWVTLVGPDGRRAWIQQFGTSLSDTTTDATVDAAGTVTVAGYTDGAMGATSFGGRDAWIARLAADGARTWTTQIGGASTDVAYGISQAAGGATIVTGTTTGSVGGAPAAGGDDVWVSRVSAVGRVEWIRQIGSAGVDSASTSAVGRNGLVYTAVTAGGALPSTTALGGTDAAIVVRYPDGSLRHVSQFGGAGNEGASGVAVLPDGRIAVTGTTEAGMFGSPAVGATDGWIAVFDPVPARMSISCRRGAAIQTRSGSTTRPTCPRGWREVAAKG